MHKSLAIYIVLTLFTTLIVGVTAGFAGYHMGLQKGQNMEAVPPSEQEPASTACPDDVSICPDGTQVGRVGPACDFAACPSPEPVPTTTSPEGVFCTQEAQQCPDGSWVGRTGPNCEFAPCP